jgi:hypothetical protein
MRQPGKAARDPELNAIFLSAECITDKENTVFIRVLRNRHARGWMRRAPSPSREAKIAASPAA